MAKRKKSKLRRKIEQKAGWILVKTLGVIVAKLPQRLLYTFGEKIGGIASSLLGKRGRVVRENLKIAFGKDKTDGEIRGIYHAFFREVGKGGVEILSLPKLSREKIIETIKIEGKENLDDALKEGKGVVGVGAHFGNFPLLCARLAAEGYPFSVIARHPRDKNLARFFSDLRDKMGIGFISDKPPGVCIRDSLACLKRNKILYLQIDLNVSSGGGKVYVDFFGKTVPTPTGPVSLAMRSGSPILPMFIVRDSEISHKIFIEPSVDLELSGDKGRDISVNIARLTKIIESYVRKYPTQWWWLHQRWRKAL